MIEVKKASAGSGKTYTLAQKYLSLLKDRYSYRHILAVTFTNKATAEMKDRILSQLAEDPERKDMLKEILHDYSSFSVSTIDRFFQRALKAFSREIGQVADYQVELDEKELTQEAMDRILDSLTSESTDVLDWLQKTVNESLEKGNRPHIEKDLYEIGDRLRSDEFIGLEEQYGVDFGKERLEKVMASCKGIIADFVKDVRATSKDLVLTGKAESMLADYRKAVAWKEMNAPRITLEKAAGGTPFMDLFKSDRFRWYKTAIQLQKQVFSLGLAREFRRSFEELLHEKNVLCLSDSNGLLRGIIDGSDAPFVYEKLGVRYENFLLDEFQDTSRVQWENFKPLLAESESYRHSSLIVGDVKQSIYRWRDSDWRLLAREVTDTFRDARVESKQDNWRSLRRIVGFNNAFFEFAARELHKEELYSDVEQTVRSSDPQEGFVKVEFCSDQMASIVQSVQDALAAGAAYSDIAVLVRGNREGSTIASRLLAEGFPVVSDDSLKLRTSSIVRRLVSLLGCMENPEDTVNAYVAADSKAAIPSGCRSLEELCENMLRSLRDAFPSEFEGQTLFIQAFMDDLHEWTAVNGENLRNYLRHWEDSDLVIGSPENSNAIRVLTIHKSKGLEFPYLIFPFAEKVNLFRAEWHWCHLSAEGTPFARECEGLYCIELSKKSSDTLFADAYEAEKDLQNVDNLNVFYVALTRAEKCLHVIAEEPARSFRDSLKKEPQYKDFSHLLYKFCGAMDVFTAGTMYDFRNRPAEKKKKLPPTNFDARYFSYPLASRLIASEDALDFFGNDGAVGIEASPRRNGIVLHGILSKIQTPDDLEGAIRDAVLDGLLDEEQASDARKLLGSRIKSHPGWFAGTGLNERSIIDISGQIQRPDRIVLLPDGSALVLDYKFTHETEENVTRHKRQVSRYMTLLKQLGFGRVSGIVWYVITGKEISV